MVSPATSIRSRLSIRRCGLTSAALWLMFASGCDSSAAKGAEGVSKPTSAAGENGAGAAGAVATAGAPAAPPSAAGSTGAVAAAGSRASTGGGGAGAAADPQAGAAAGQAGVAGTPTQPSLPAAGSGGASGAPAPSGSIFAPIDDPAMPGPYGFERVDTAPGLETHTLFVPAKLGENGLKHPIIVWTNGAGGSTSLYQNLLEHFASHGFFIVADKMSGGDHDPEIVEQKAGIEWAIAEAARADSPYFGKIDSDRLGIAGHSLGSVGSFANTGHEKVKASIHWSGGLTGNPVGADEAWLQLIHAPAAFLCGGAEARALPRCSGDFDNAPEGVPIFYGTVEGVGHTDVFGEPNGGQWGRAAVAWWRLQLAGDESFRSWFAGAACELCASPWMGKSRNL